MNSYLKLICKLAIHFLLGLNCFYLPIANADTNTSSAYYSIFNKLFQDWTIAFNKKDLAKSCSLFSHQIRADYQGYPNKSYTTICDGFKKIFQEKNREYRYQFKIHYLFQADNLAVVRITWYLDIFENKTRLSTTKDEGIDVLEKDEHGEWKIVSYLAYPIQQQGKLFGWNKSKNEDRKKMML